MNSDTNLLVLPRCPSHCNSNYLERNLSIAPSASVQHHFWVDVLICSDFSFWLGGAASHLWRQANARRQVSVWLQPRGRLYAPFGLYPPLFVSLRCMRALLSNRTEKQGWTSTHSRHLFPSALFREGHHAEFIAEGECACTVLLKVSADGWLGRFLLCVEAAEIRRFQGKCKAEVARLFVEGGG
jgi:hypothetical protein